MVKKHQDLKVWEKAMNLADYIYSVTENYPKREIFSLAAQMRRAAVSIPSNIAEGNARSGDKEFHRFISVAKGSLAELETQLILSRRRQYINTDTFDKLMKLSDEVDKMLYSLQQKLKEAA